MQKKFQVFIEENKRSKPRPHEDSAAKFLADFFQSDIVFLRRLQSKTPDLYVLKTNIRWELKSPTGKSKYTIQNNLREAAAQSENVILDFHHLGMPDQRGIARARNFIKTENTQIKRLKNSHKR